jgi:hypothetical protein
MDAGDRGSEHEKDKRRTSHTLVGGEREEGRGGMRGRRTRRRRRRECEREEGGGREEKKRGTRKEEGKKKLKARPTRHFVERSRKERRGLLAWLPRADEAMLRREQENHEAESSKQHYWPSSPLAGEDAFPVGKAGLLNQHTRPFRGGPGAVSGGEALCGARRGAGRRRTGGGGSAGANAKCQWCGTPTWPGPGCH